MSPLSIVGCFPGVFHDFPADSATFGPEAELCAGQWLCSGKWRGMSNMVNANRVDSVVPLSNNPKRAGINVAAESAGFVFLPDCSDGLSSYRGQ